MSLLDMNIGMVGMMGGEEEVMEGGFGMAASFDDFDGAFDEATEDAFEAAFDEALAEALFEEADEGDADESISLPVAVTQAALETAMEAVSKAATENSLESRIEAFLNARRGESLTNWMLAKEFGITTRRCVKALKRLMRRNRVRVVMVAGRRQYYVPTAEQWQKLNELREAKMRSVGEYKLPQPMLDVWNRIRAERSGVPSYYGGAV